MSRPLPVIMSLHDEHELARLRKAARLVPGVIRQNRITFTTIGACAGLFVGTTLGALL